MDRKFWPPPPTAPPKDDINIRISHFGSKAQEAHVKPSPCGRAATSRRATATQTPWRALQFCKAEDFAYMLRCHGFRFSDFGTSVFAELQLQTCVACDCLGI